MNSTTRAENDDCRSVSVAGLTIDVPDVQSGLEEFEALKTPKSAKRRIRWAGVTSLVLMLISSAVMCFVVWSLYRAVTGAVS